MKVSWSQCGVSLQLYADDLKCVSRDPGLLFRAARFTAGYVRPAPSKCVLLSTSKAVRAEMRGWVLSDEGHKHYFERVVFHFVPQGTSCHFSS